MLKEKKGNGRGYGIPNWVLNQTRDFMAEPRAVLYFRHGEINYYRSVFHHLNDYLEYHEQLSSEFHGFASQEDFKDEAWLVVMKDFLEHLEATREDFKHVFSENTYNHESMLDQDVQYEYFTLDSDPFVLLHIHNGEDIRSGYTTLYVFSMYDESFFCFADGCIKCDSCDAFWYTDDAFHWYFEATIGIVHEKVNLEDLLDDLAVDDSGNATCPRCHVGKLIV